LTANVVSKSSEVKVGSETAVSTGAWRLYSSAPASAFAVPSPSPSIAAMPARSDGASPPGSPSRSIALSSPRRRESSLAGSISFGSAWTFSASVTRPAAAPPSASWLGSHSERVRLIAVWWPFATARLSPRG